MSDLPKAKTRPASNWSAIWVLPLIALIIGGWLGWRAYSQQGIEIQVRFESGEGIQVNKTEVVYKGMPVGKVKTLALDDEGNNRGVIATIEMNKDVEQYLKTNTRFWLGQTQRQPRRHHRPGDPCVRELHCRQPPATVSPHANSRRCPKNRPCPTPSQACT